MKAWYFMKRRFNGGIYHYDSRHKEKPMARKQAEYLRSRGKKARVTKEYYGHEWGQWWIVWAK